MKTLLGFIVYCINLSLFRQFIMFELKEADCCMIAGCCVKAILFTFAVDSPESGFYYIVWIRVTDRGMLCWRHESFGLFVKTLNKSVYILCTSDFFIHGKVYPPFFQALTNRGYGCPKEETKEKERKRKKRGELGYSFPPLFLLLIFDELKLDILSA